MPRRRRCPPCGADTRSHRQVQRLLRRPTPSRTFVLSTSTAVMTVSDELEYLKSLVSQLNEKIHVLEAKTKDAVLPSKTPAQQLRTVLVGPPGAGASPRAFVRKRLVYLNQGVMCPQGRAPRPHAYETNSVSATSPRATCCVTRLRGRRSSASRPRRSWMPEGSSGMTSWWA